MIRSSTFPVVPGNLVHGQKAVVLRSIAAVVAGIDVYRGIGRKKNAHVA